MDDLVSDFISETSESLLNLDNELVELENDPNNLDLVGKIFRVMHTIKGTCGFLGLDKLAKVAHSAENILDRMRSKKIIADSKNISVLLEAIDTIKSIVDHIQANDGKEPEVDYSWLTDKINNTLNAEDPPKPKQTEDVDLDKLFENKAEAPASAPAAQASSATQTPVEDTPQPTSAPITPETPKEPTVAAAPSNTASPASDAAPSNTPAAPKAATSVIEEDANQAIRVKIEVLDRLMQSVSELVLARNQLLQLERDIHDDKFSSCLQNLNFITSAIQETVMNTRLQPISNAWIKVPRMIRDLSKDLNKKIKLEMIGKDTELDRQLIESIKDPLVHMIRNSADHGLESEEVRIAAGKPPEGTITLQAYHSSGSIIIEVSDDGAGLDIKKIKSKILEKGLATESQIAQLTEKQLIQYIFRAGFSTSDKITAVSGRGVGMDVVKSNIEAIRGSVEIRSVTGKGSSFVLKIPLTLAIMPILVVESSNQKFGIPQATILEMLRVEKGTQYKIEEMNDHLILRLRDTLIPLEKLSKVLKLEEDNKNLQEEYYIVICEVRGKSFGLIVDNIFDTEEIVLKPLSTLLKNITVYSGTTLLGNGDIILILTPSGIAQNISLLNTEESQVIPTENNETSALAKFLIIKSGDVFKAVPLEVILRLEEIDTNRIEKVDKYNVVQYMNSLMYLVLFDPEYKIPKNGKQQIIVFKDNEHYVGLVVEKIVDIATQNIEQNLSFEEGNLTNLIIGDKTLDIINVTDYFDQITAFKVKKNEANQQYKILLIEESPYFRKLISSSLKLEGFNVISAKNGEEAIKIIDNESTAFNLILNDVNSHSSNGILFIQNYKTNQKIQNLPIVGLSNQDELYEINEDEKLYSEIVTKSEHQILINIIYSLLGIKIERDLDD